MPLTKIQSLGITDGTIVNADINASAAIAGTKLTGVGKVLQVIQSTVTSASSATATLHTASFADKLTIISASITPSSASNNILIFYNVNVCSTTGSNAIHLGRGSTQIFLADSASNRVRSTLSMNLSDQYNSELISGVYLDSPSTTSATTYYVKHSSYTGSVYINRSEADRNDANGYDGRSVCSLVLLEIAA